LQRRMRVPSFRAITRKPSCLISCTQRPPEGGCPADTGRQGAMKPAGNGLHWRGVRDSMSRQCQ
jgi:hypothetical protein